MIDDTEFSELTLLWDSREQSNVAGRPRVKRLTEWFTRRGGMVNSMALPRCDYHIGGGYDEKAKKFLSGTFRGKDINLGIEYKTFNDYNKNKEDLNSKLFEAGKLYSAIALFVEENNFALSFTDLGTFIKIPQVAEGNANITQYAYYKNHLDTLASDGVHVRTFQSEVFFEEDVYSVLLHLAKDCHTGLHIKGKDYNTMLLNVLGKFEGIGGVKAHKIIDVIPNLQSLIELINYDEHNILETLIGHISAKTLRSFITNQSRIELCRNNYIKMIPDKTVIPLIEEKEEIKPKDIKTRNTKRNKKDSHLDINLSLFTPPHSQLISNDSGITSKGDATLPSLSEKLPQPDSIGSVEDKLSSRGYALTHDITGKENVVCEPLTSLPDSRHMPSSFLKPPTLTNDGNGQEKGTHSHQSPDALDKNIVDFCYDMPRSDGEIIEWFRCKGYTMQEIHKTLLALSKEKLHKYKEKGITMFSYKDLKADKDFDIGV